MAEAQKLPAGTADKVRKLLEALADLRSRENMLLEEVAALMGGGAGIGARLKMAEGAFAAAWSQRYAGAYVWSYAKDRTLLKGLLGKMVDGEILDRMVAYIKDDDQFLVRARHPFGLFVSSVNRYAAAPRDVLDLLEAPADCKHDPPCRDDQEHTRRKGAEMRGQPF